ncbi:MAG: hypothetical protein GY726_05670 [Proteobacteria bacterium]|nr:hypothetical protein [Pseudomonadota bacterium]
MSLKLSQITLVVVFLLATTAPLLLFNDATEFSSREKRSLASPPEWRWDWQLLNDYPAQFTAWFDDHYGLRSELIKRSQHFKKKYFKKSPTWLVIRGEQDWLFMDKRDSLKDHIGQKQLSKESLAQWEQQLLKKQQWLNSQGIEYLIAPIPNKMTLYSSYLPPRIQRHSGITVLDQLLAYLSEEAKYSAYIELEPVLFAYQGIHPEQRLYFKSDTHWTSLGAFIAYQHIMQQLRKRLPTLEPELSMGEMRRETTVKKGDLAIIIDQGDELEELSSTLLPVKPCASDFYAAISMNRAGESSKQAEESAVVFNGCAKNKFTAVIVYDSFGEAIRRFFSESFRRAIFVSDYERGEMTSLLSSEQPDVYLDLRVERNLRSLFNSDALLQQGLEKE